MEQRNLRWIFLLIFILGTGYISGSPAPEVGWSSNEVPNEATCTYVESQFENLLNILQKTTQQLQKLSVGTEVDSGMLLSDLTALKSSISIADNKCDNFISQLEAGFVNLASDLSLLKTQGSCSASKADKAKVLQENNDKLKKQLEDLVREHSQSVANLTDEFETVIQQREFIIKKQFNEIKRQQESLRIETIENIVSSLRLGNVDKALNKIKRFDKNAAFVEIVKNCIKKLYGNGGMQHFDTLIRFIDRLSNCAGTIGGFRQLLAEMNPLVEIDTRILMKVAYRVLKHSCHDTGVKYLFPVTIRDLFWHSSCKIKNKVSGHYMKVISENQNGHLNDIIVGEDSSYGSSSWKLSPYQSTYPSGEVVFRVENIGTGKYLKDAPYVEFGQTVGRPNYMDAKWEVTFPNNRVKSHYGNNDVYFYSPKLNRYLQEAKRYWEPWRCGTNQWLDCAVINEEEGKVYEVGKWVLEF